MSCTMNCERLTMSAFVPSYSTLLSTSCNPNKISCKRRLSTSSPIKTLSRRPSPRMMAKYQQKEESNTSQPENEASKLEEIVPQPLLPTLTTLSGDTESNSSATDNDIDLSKISNMGAGLSPEEESSIFSFLKGVVSEWKEVEWPSFSRVLRLTVIVALTIIIAAIVLYFVDGFFYRLSQIVFEDKL